MSAMHGSSATAQQSQSTDIFFITLMKTVLSLKYSATDEAASAIASRKLSWSAVQILPGSPAPWM